MPGLDQDVGGWEDWLNNEKPVEKLANESCPRCDGTQVVEKNPYGEGESYWCPECGLGWWYDWEDRETVYQVEKNFLSITDRMRASPYMVVLFDREEPG